VLFVRRLRNSLRSLGGAVAIVQTLAEPPMTMFGHFDARHASTLRARVRAFNQGLTLDMADGQDVLLDVAALSGVVGTANWFSSREWHLAKMPIAMACQPLYADHVCRVLGAMRGKARRCLILDLDNTLWGGVIGDDGLDGIRLGQGDPVGEAHLALQRYALMLHQRGVVLAVCSKNEEAVAREVFRKHPDMLLREEHIAVFQANWVDKAGNIRAIAQELSLGLSSFVFVDDNPAERAIVRQHLPEVAVPELSDDPAQYEQILASAGYFEAITFSQEDAARTGFYRDNARRAELLEQSGDLDAYLASLDMEIHFSPFDAIGRSRIVQLINKSNQFNLTTRRYGAVEIEAMAGDPDLITLQVRLSDRFGDNGMISTVILRPSDESDVWEIDLWLMSCRVLGRRVEDAVLNEISMQVRQRGGRWLKGAFIPTDRNMIVRDHYARLGFEADGQGDDGVTYWRWPTDRARPDAPMRRGDSAGAGGI
jgi:FkbH-like protein